MEYKSQYGIINYIPTPWNSRVINGNSMDIESCYYNTEEDLSYLFQSFTRDKEQEGYVFFSIRIHPQDLPLKKYLLLSGFIVVEHILDVVINPGNFTIIDELRKRFPVKTSPYNEEYFGQVSEIVLQAFQYGRFFEDPFFLLSQAKDRNLLWLGDLVSTPDVSIDILLNKNTAVGFLAYKIKSESIELILGGVKEQFRHLSYGFWAKILAQFAEFREIRTVISSSNIDILNLYSYMDFRFENPRFGFHKHILL